MIDLPDDIRDTLSSLEVGDVCQLPRVDPLFGFPLLLKLTGMSIDKTRLTMEVYLDEFPVASIGVLLSENATFEVLYNTGGV